MLQSQSSSRRPLPTQCDRDKGMWLPYDLILHSYTFVDNHNLSKLIEKDLSVLELEAVWEALLVQELEAV